MRKKIMNFAAVAAILFFGACSNQDEVLTENTESERTITITASMPDEGPDTRVALTPEGKSIKLTWEVGNRLQFAIVQGGSKYRRVLTLGASNISNDEKTVSFDIVLPSEIVEGQPYDLYGIFGFESNTAEEGGLSVSNPTNVILTKNPGSRGTLANVRGLGDVMLYFESKGLDTSTPPTSVTFKHLGSLFAVSFNNTVNPSASTVTEARLVGVDENGNTLTNGSWAYNNGVGGQIYDLVSGEFQNKSTAGNYISFSTTQSTWTVEQTTTLWGWYPPIPEQAWPALRLEMTTDDGTVVLPSTNIKPARQAAPEAGKVYHFYARWNGSVLNLTNDQYVTE